MIKCKLVIRGEIASKDPMAEAFGVIEDCFSDVDCENFLSENKEADEIEVEITSPGGSVEMGFRIHDMLVGSGKKITTIAYKADSIATVIFLAGSTRLVAENCKPLVHNPMIHLRDGVMLNAKQLGEMKAETEIVEKQLIDFYVAKLSLDKDSRNSLKELMDLNTPISAKEFVKLGFATDMIKTNMTVRPSIAKAYNMRMVAIANENNKTNNIMEKEMLAFKKTIENLGKLFKFKAQDDGTIVPDVVASSITLQDESIIYTDTESVEAGVTKAFSDEAMTAAAADGEYITAEGATLTVNGGIITTMVEIAATTETDLDIANAKIAELNDIIVATKKANDELIASTNAIKEAFEANVKTYNTFVATTTGAGKLADNKALEKHPNSVRLELMREARSVGKN